MLGRRKGDQTQRRPDPKETRPKGDQTQRRPDPKETRPKGDQTQRRPDPKNVSNIYYTLCRVLIFFYFYIGMDIYIVYGIIDPYIILYII
jgi:hypothetical protein